MDKQTWGTWEELLLACAVHRYGTDSWESVALEVQKRSPSLTALTGLSCKHKYYDLKRRFRQSDAVSGNNDDNNMNIPWLEELRQLRVAELRREVERYDVSIVSLQSKVKRLKEERETNLREKEREKERSDLEKPTGEADKGGGGGGEVEKSSGEDSDRENRSVNESNETDPKEESPANEDVKTPAEQAAAGWKAKEASCNSVAAEESMAESKGGDGGESEGRGGVGKESSEVQSSASLAMKEEKEEVVAEEEERGNEGNGSPAIKMVDVESQPLVDFLEILRCHKLGSFFQRRFDTQETTHLYTKLIRQHIDLETIRSRVDEGWYSGCNKKFFRDLLLLFNNAIVFFNKQFAEYLAAVELRQLVLKEMGVKVANPDPLPRGKPLELPDQEPINSLEVKSKMGVLKLMVACRKRSSIPTKASSSLFSAGANKGEQMPNLLEVKPVEDLKRQDKSKDKAEENCDAKKRSRDRSIPSARSTNKNSKTRNSTRTNKDSDANSKAGLSSKAGSQTLNMESKNEKEMRSTTNSSSKKKGAANFLNRMKQGSPVSNEPLLESLRQPVSGHSKAAEQTRSSNGKSDARKNQNSRKGSGGKQESQRVSPVKKGRPPKRAAAPLPPSPIVTAKRGREVGKTEAGSSGPGKKRSRR